MTAKLMHGFGFNSKREHKTQIDGKVTRAYQAWRDMFRRCYSLKFHEISSVYIGCKVSSEWHDFQDFADWFYEAPYSNADYDLDKDILIPNNKIYSPETCCFIPQELNKLLTDHRSARGVCPQGVYYHKPTSKYLARMKYNGKSRHLGLFDCPQEAHQAYKKTKEAYVKEKALEWQNRIADNVFQALMSWTLDN